LPPSISTCSGVAITAWSGPSPRSSSSRRTAEQLTAWASSGMHVGTPATVIGVPSSRITTELEPSTETMFVSPGSACNSTR